MKHKQDCNEREINMLCEIIQRISIDSYRSGILRGDDPFEHVILTTLDVYGMTHERPRLIKKVKTKKKK